jgi:ribosome maturation factor RimP
MTDSRPNHTGLEGRIAEIIMEPLEAQGYELVRVQVIGTEAPTVQIMADRADGVAFTHEDCTTVSHLLSAVRMLKTRLLPPGRWKSARRGSTGR